MVSAIPLIGGIPAGPKLLIILLVLVPAVRGEQDPEARSIDRPSDGRIQEGREQVEDELQQMQSDDENESPLETDSTVNDDDDEFETETEKETSA